MRVSGSRYTTYLARAVPERALAFRALEESGGWIAGWAGLEAVRSIAIAFASSSSNLLRSDIPISLTIASACCSQAEARSRSPRFLEAMLSSRSFEASTARSAIVARLSTAECILSMALAAGSSLRRATGD
jgi:hypothetical protein